MSQQNVETVRNAWGAVGAPGRSFLLEAWDPDLRIDNMPEFPVQGPYRGYEGLAQWRAELDDAIDDLHFELLEVIEVDDERVLSVQRALGRAPHTQIPIDQVWASVFRLRRGRIVHAQGYWTREQALEAVGLSE